MGFVNSVVSDWALFVVITEYNCSSSWTNHLENGSSSFQISWLVKKQGVFWTILTFVFSLTDSSPFHLK
jgi:hypothetical protein